MTNIWGWFTTTIKNDSKWWSLGDGLWHWVSPTLFQWPSIIRRYAILFIHHFWLYPPWFLVSLHSTTLGKIYCWVNFRCLTVPNSVLCIYIYNWGVYIMNQLILHPGPAASLCAARRPPSSAPKFIRALAIGKEKRLMNHWIKGDFMDFMGLSGNLNSGLMMMS